MQIIYRLKKEESIASDDNYFKRAMSSKIHYYPLIALFLVSE